MINSYKNFERLRYRMSKDLRDLFDDSKPNVVNLQEQLSSTIFASVFSGIITEVVLKESNLTDCKKLLFLFISFVVAYIILYCAYHFIIRRIVRFWDVRKINKIDTSDEVMFEIIKDFDNIACDSILAAQGYRQEFEKLNVKEKNIQAFYYFEIMHYLETACNKTMRLVDYHSRCIRTCSQNEAAGVDIYRVYNIKSLMDAEMDFLTRYFDSVCEKDHHKKEIENRLEIIRKDIGEIDSKIAVI